jgi:putative transposase
VAGEAGRAGKPPILDIGEDRWAEAVRREAMVRSLAVREDTNRAEIGVAARALGLSAAQLYRLLGAYRANPVTQSLVVNRPGPPKGHRLLPAAIEAVITEAIETIFLQRERPTLARLCREVGTSCRGAGLKPPSRKAIAARIAARSLKDTVTAREGAAVANARFALVRPGLRARAPLDIVQIDHTRVDVQLVDDWARAPLGRPWLTLLLDVHSRCVLGFTVSFDAPSAAGVALAIAQGVLSKTTWLAERELTLAWPVHGLPRALHLDNGREFHSRALLRGCQQHGIRIDYRPPATPRFGGHIERLMGTLMTRMHALPGTTGSNVAARGDYPSEARAILTLREFERILALEVLGPYHNNLHTALGTSPAAAWEAGIVASGTPRLPTNHQAFVLDFLPFEERVVRREGVRLFNIHYFDGALAPLLESPNRKHRVKYEPRDISAVFVELPQGGHIRTPYADLGRPPVSLWEQRLAVRSLREQGRKTVDEHAIFTAIEEQRQVVTEAYAKSKTARRAIARMPAAILRRPPLVSTAAEHTAANSNDASDDSQKADDARVPTVADDDAWKTEFLS